jgi:arylsulfatase A-like enzyme
VFLTADHGDMMGAHRLWGKGFCAYEEVVKVPFLAAGPGLPTGPSQARVSLLDILPTVCRLAGIEVPARCDGRDLRQSVSDGGPELLFSFHAGLLIVDDGRWRLSINQLAGTVELYDRQADPGEYVNLAHVPAGASARMRLERAALDQMMTATLDIRQPPLAAENDFFHPARNCS